MRGSGTIKRDNCRLRNVVNAGFLREIKMGLITKTPTIFHSFRSLKGNTRVSVLFQPLWGIPFTLYSFYLSLYMKAQGVTDAQIGFLIGLGCVTSILFALLGGIITDALGRKKTTLIFDLISWPGSLFLYLIANSFWLFALAIIFNNVVRVVAISWNLMVIEDANREQQVGAYNLINAINIAVGILTPTAGLLVHCLGILSAERILITFAILSMTAMILIRNHYYRETGVGLQILAEAKGKKRKATFQVDFYRNALTALKAKPAVLMALSVVILYNTYIPIGTYSSLYFAPYLTDVLQLDKSAISILGGVISVTMFSIFVLLLPIISGGNRIIHMITGTVIQIASLLFLIIIPPANFWLGILTVTLFAIGFGIAKPFVDSLLAEVTAGKERSGVYALNNTAISALSALIGFTSGYLYHVQPASIYILSIFILLGCTGILVSLNSQKTQIENIIDSQNPAAGNFN
jgi:MFS family permease